MKLILTSLLLSFFLMLPQLNLQAQDDMPGMPEMPDDLPYHVIPDAPENYSAENVASRMIDGLGYRYFWATEGLRKEDLAYKIGETNRTTEETVVHVYNLSKTILNAVSKKPNISGAKSSEEMNFEKYRKRTLENLKLASDLLRKENANVEDMKIIFQRGEKQSEYPFWNLLNGPIADAMWHAGQIVANRRASGNPLHPGVSVFRGKTKF